MIDTAGRLLFGVHYKRQLADLLDLRSEDTVSRWATGKMRPAPGARLEMAAELERRMARMPAIIKALRDGVDEVHGLSRDAIELVGWLIGDAWIMEGEDWLSHYASPAEALRNRVARELGEQLQGGRAKLSEGEADRLLTALGRLTDAEALEVAQEASKAASQS